MAVENLAEWAGDGEVFSAEWTPKGDKNNLIFVDTDVVLDLLIEHVSRFMHLLWCFLLWRKCKNSRFV